VADDLFSRLFDLFNQPGPINWKLAAELAHHLAGEPQPVDPWEAEQVVELAHFAGPLLEKAAPFPVRAGQVAVVDPRQWCDQALHGFTYLGQAVGEASHPGIPGLGSALAGMQVGTVVGTTAAGSVGAFEAGLPIDGEQPLLIIGPGLSRVAAASGADIRDVRLWGAGSELAHQALFAVPWLIEHLSGLLASFATQLLPDPSQIMEMWSTDPASWQEQLSDPETFEQLLGGEEAAPAREAVEAFLTVTSGYRHHLTRRALGRYLPSLDRLHSPQPAPAEVPGGMVPAIGIPLADHEMTVRGAEFCSQIEHRYGVEAVDGLWLGPERLPTAAEIGDPVGWAARVLLEDLTTG
jgi:putative hydrolase